MSLILDALKKSESERQREKAPGLQSIHQPSVPRAAPRTRNHWWLMGMVVLVNAAVLVYWRWPPPAPTTARDAAAPAATVTKSAPAVTPPTERADVAESVQAEFTRITPASPSTTPAPADTSQRIEEVGELPEEVRNNLPAMTFSFHVYSANPQQRTIIINNRRMREGEEVSAGLLLQEITDDGVILLHAGHRIHISVLSGW